MNKNKNTLVVDGNAMAYRSLYATGNLSKDNIGTGVVFGFLHQIFKYAKLYKSSDFIFCWDSKDSLRRILYDKNYKANRIDKRKELSKGEQNVLNDAFRQFDLLRKEILFELGFRNIFYRRGYESDDLIAIVINCIRDNYIIISNDNDLWQLIRSDVQYLGMRDGKVITEEFFIKEYGIKPIEWAEVKAIAGCKGDNVIGIKGVGEVKALEFILNKSKGKDREKILKNSNLIKKNRLLVKLPFDNNIKFEIKENKLSRDKFIEVFNRLSFKSFLELNYFKKINDIFFN